MHNTSDQKCVRHVSISDTDTDVCSIDTSDERCLRRPTCVGATDTDTCDYVQIILFFFFKLLWVSTCQCCVQCLITFNYVIFSNCYRCFQCRVLCPVRCLCLKKLKRERERDHTVLVEVCIWSHLTELARLGCWPCHQKSVTETIKHK